MQSGDDALAPFGRHALDGGSQIQMHYRRGVAAGEFRKGLDLDIVIDGFYGPIYYRLLVPYAGLSNSYIDSLAMNVLRGIACK